MTRAQLEHIIRAAGSITDENEIVVLGSQSILGAVPHPPPELTVSIEADVCPRGAPHKADLISGAIGEISHFQDTFGYYAHGLPPDACALPSGWESRLVPISNDNTRGVTGLCLDPLDLACAKLVAGREKDLDFVGALLRHALVTEHALIASFPNLPRASDRERAAQNLVGAVRRLG